jgi:hypothetical protein
VVASRRAKYDDNFRVPTLSGVKPIDGKHRHGSITWGGSKTSARAHTACIPVRAKTRRQTITPDGTPGPLCQRIPGWRKSRFHFTVFLSPIIITYNR